MRTPVLLAGAPLDVLAAFDGWLDDVFAELHANASDLPDRLVGLGESLQSVIERPRAVLEDQVLSPAAGGVKTADLTVDFEMDAVTYIGRMMLILDELDHYAETGGLAAGPRTPEMVAVLQWMGREIIGQLEIGRPPRPYHRGTGATA